MERCVNNNHQGLQQIFDSEHGWDIIDVEATLRLSSCILFRIYGTQNYLYKTGHGIYFEVLNAN